MSQHIPPHVLVILDGWGIGEPTERNAIYVANPQNFNSYWETKPHTTLKSWGTAVGLPESEMGNSEVGHMTIGCGTVIKQHALKISEDIMSHEFENTERWKSILNNFTGKTIHLGGLLSNARVHSSVMHVEAIFKYLSGNYNVVFHAFTDGRDSGTTDSQHFFDNLPESIRAATVTVSGRYYAMDRDHNWERTQKAYTTIVEGKGESFEDFGKAVMRAYEHDQTDEFVEPCVIGNYSGMEENDLFFVFNFREDRIRQISQAISDPQFSKFPREHTYPVASLTEFEDAELSYIPFVYPKIRTSDTLSDKLSYMNLSQLHVAESEKYAHVTYFFNGGREESVTGEKHIIIDSPDVATYDLQPEMSSIKVADTVVQNLDAFDFIVVNFANPDMVAHTGNMAATIKAVLAADEQMGRIVSEVKKRNGHVYITADHGNAEVLQHKNASNIDTKHNRNPSPFIYIGDGESSKIKDLKGLSDIAGFILSQIQAKE